LNRVSVKAEGEAALFSEIEVLPRLRSMRGRLSVASNPVAGRQSSQLESTR
jgi:hypothetical protein